MSKPIVPSQLFVRPSVLVAVALCALAFGAVACKEKTASAGSSPRAATATAAAAAAASAQPNIAADRRNVAPPVATPPAQRRATGAHVAVTTAHPLASQAALKALKSGGNAVDAMVAASFMLTVVTPQSTGIGGGGFAIVWPGGGNDAHALDFREQAPAAGTRAQYLDADGHAVAKRSQRHGLAVGVPGYVAGLWALHKRWGKLPWASLVAPAVAVAERGFVMGDILIAAAKDTWGDLDPNARAVIGQHGKAPPAGSVLRQPALGRTLRTIGIDGPAGFYGGAVAKDLVATVQAAGGKLSLLDLANYKPRWRKPLVGSALGLTVITMPQPSAGGAQLVAMAEFMQRFTGAPGKSTTGKSSTGKSTTGKSSTGKSNTGKSSTGKSNTGKSNTGKSNTGKSNTGKSNVGKSTPASYNPSQHLSVAHALAESMRRAFQLRLAFSGDVAVPATKLDEVYPAALRRRLAASFDPAHATVSKRLIRGKLEGHNNTSHISIIDASGMAIASTHTVNLLFGSGIVAASSGVWLNNELDDFSFTLTDSNYFGLAGSKANLFRPGARPVSSMTPSIFLAHGKPALIIGSPGGTRIPTAVFQVAWRTLIAGQPLRAAVDAPRLHHQAFPDEVWVEAGAGEQLWRKGLASLGHKIVAKEPWCDVQAVRIHREKAGKSTFEAVSDGRGEGSARAY